MRPIYLDYNATTPIHPEVADAMRPYLGDLFGNPSSSHWYGRQTRLAVDRARGRLAALLGCDPDEVIFTSGGSEANNHAIKGVAALRGGGRVITSAVEHPAVAEPCAWLAGRGFQITVLPVDHHGRVSVEDLEAAIGPDVILVSVMHANNEVGTIQPIAQLAAVAHAHGALFHTDAAQSVGKVPVDPGELGVDLLTVAGHKLYAPKGVGALYLRRGIELPKFIHGADHERDQRAGTENVLQLVGLGAAAEIAARDLDSVAAHTASMRDRLQRGLCMANPEVRVNGHPVHRLPNTLSVSFPRVEANTLLEQVDAELAASAGAACHTGSVEVSTVLQAMGVPTHVAMGTVRLSTGRATTAAEVDQAVEVLGAAARRLGSG